MKRARARKVPAAAGAIGAATGRDINPRSSPANAKRQAQRRAAQRKSTSRIGHIRVHQPDLLLPWQRPPTVNKPQRRESRRLETEGRICLKATKGFRRRWINQKDAILIAHLDDVFKHAPAA